MVHPSGESVDTASKCSSAVEKYAGTTGRWLLRRGIENRSPTSERSGEGVIGPDCMGTHREITIYCDRCWIADDARYDSVRPAREHARRCGWLLNRGGKDYCPNCRELIESGDRIR